MIWSVPRMWEEGDVWILGGGPSVPRQFGIPEKVVQDVINGISPPSVYSPYMKALHDKHVIGINVAYLIGNWIDSRYGIEPVGKLVGVLIGSIGGFVKFFKSVASMISDEKRNRTSDKREN